ncbi:transglycosylase family protein [Streptomyces sp. JNUCC 64]
MLSGNGRHRRPRQAPALVVAAGVTSSAIAIPLLGATGAHAAEAATWDRLAECESGGAWSSDEGNGFYGGLQISQEAWDQHGGLDYALSPDQASRSQQIAVGERILAASGPAAWPGCGEAVKLTKGGPKADVDPGGPGSGRSDSGSVSAGVTAGKTDTSRSTADQAPATKSPDSKPSSGATGSAEPSDPASPSAPATGSTGSTGSGEPTDDTTGSAGPTDSADPSTSPSEEPGSSPSTDPSPGGTEPGGTESPGEGTGSGSAEPGTESPSSSPTPDGAAASEIPADATAEAGAGRHRGEAAAEDAAASRAEESAGRHASRAATRDELDKSYTVQSGDNLSAIADSQGVEGGWTALYDGNKGTVGADPDHILPGQSLDLAPEKAEKQQ